MDAHLRSGWVYRPFSPFPIPTPPKKWAVQERRRNPIYRKARATEKEENYTVDGAAAVPTAVDVLCTVLWSFI